MFDDVYEDEDAEDAKEIVDAAKEPVLAKILEESNKLKKGLKKTEEEQDALQYLITLDDMVYKDPVDEMNEILLFDTTINNLMTRNIQLFEGIKNSLTPECTVFTRSLFDKAREDAVKIMEEAN